MEVSLTSFSGQLEKIPKYRPLYLFIKYYFLQHRLDATPHSAPHFVLFSVLYAVQVLASNNSFLTLGDLFLLYIQYYGNKQSYLSGNNDYSFISYYDSLLKQFHISWDCQSAMMHRYVHVDYYHLDYI